MEAKGLLKKKIKSSTRSDNSLVAGLFSSGTKIQLNFDGACLKQGI